MNQKQKTAIMIAVCLFLFAAIKLLMLNWWTQQQTQQAKISNAPNCQITQNACDFGQGQTLQLIGIKGNKTPFTAEARGIPEDVQNITLSFSMRDMNMGFNRFELQKQGNGVWRLEQIYLPLCTANRHDWTVQWQINTQKYTTDFQTLPEKP